MLMLPSGGVAMAFIEGTRQCLKCGGEAFQSLPDYSAASWQIVECPACRFVYMRKQLVSEFTREKTWMAEVKRRKARSPVRMWLDRMTRWRAGIYSPGIAGLLKRMFAPGRVLDEGCGSGKKVPEPFIPFGVEISEELFRAADAHMRAGGPRHPCARRGWDERISGPLPHRNFAALLPRARSDA